MAHRNAEWLSAELNTHGSLFTGIGGFDLGFERAGFKTIWQVEIDPFCRAVLKSRFPKVGRYRDVRKVGRRNLLHVDVITAGIPCQDVSIAGKRQGLAGERTGLFYEFARILRELRPAWFVFENVPGLFSSNRGRDFAEILRVLMVECGYGVSWRVLNSQFFGVAQRRRRVFVVGCFGKACPPEVLFERESSAGNPAASQETGTDLVFALAASVRGTGDGHGNAWNSNYVAHALTNQRNGRYDPNGEEYVVANSLRESDGHHGRSSPRGDGCDNLIAAPLSAGSFDSRDIVATLNSGGNDGGFRIEPGEHIVIQDVRGHREKRQHGIGISEGGPSYTLSKTERHAVAYMLGSNDRNKSQGPANYICDGLYGAHTEPGPHAGDAERVGLCADESWQRWEKAFAASDDAAGNCAPIDADRVRDFAGLPEGLDSARYRALGNAVTVQVAEWIGVRILKADG